jgi:O-antigen ligase
VTNREPPTSDRKKCSVRTERRLPVRTTWAKPLSPVYAFAVTGLLGVAAFLVNPLLGFAVLATAVLMAYLDWRATTTALLGLYVGGVMFVSSSYRVRGGLPIDLTADRLILSVLFAACVMGWIRTRSQWPEAARGAGRPLAGLLIVAYASFVVNAADLVATDQFATAAKRLVMLAGFALVYVSVVLLLGRRQQILAIVRILVNLGFVVAVAGIAERLVRVNPLRRLQEVIPILEMYRGTGIAVRGAGNRILGTANHPIEFGAVMALILPLTLFLAFAARDTRPRLWYGAAATAQALALMFSASRSALIALAVAFVILMVGAKPKHRGTMLALAATGAVATHFLFPGVLSTFSSMLRPAWLIYDETTGTSTRFGDYPAVAALFWARPLLGMGYEALDVERYFHLDNQYLKFLVELGALGVFMIAWFFERLLRPLLRAMRENALDEPIPLAGTLLASVASYVVSCAFFDTFGFPQVTNLFFLVAGLSVVVVSLTDTQRSALSPARAAAPDPADVLQPETGEVDRAFHTA